MHRSLPRFLQKHLQRCRFGLGQFRFFASAFFFAAVAPQKSSTCSHTLQPDSQTRREAPRTAVVVRICQPTAAALRRIAEWARQCTESQRSARIDFFMSIDATRTDRCKLRGAIRTALEAEGLALEHVPLHWYTESDLESAFPVMTEIRIALPQGSQNIPSRDPKSLAWGLHCECINLWRASISDSYDFFWVFEDDVGVSGNFRELIVSYLDDDSDLITGSSIDIAKPCWPPNFTLSASKERGWNWYYTATSEYRRRASEIYVAQEFVQRFSKDLLEELKNWSESDASAWSEQMSPTVCKVAGMRCRSLRPEQIGHTFTWNGRVSKEDWMAICEEVKVATQLPQRSTCPDEAEKPKRSNHETSECGVYASNHETSECGVYASSAYDIPCGAPRARSRHFSFVACEPQQAQVVRDDFYNAVYPIIDVG